MIPTTLTWKILEPSSHLESITEVPTSPPTSTSSAVAANPNVSSEPPPTNHQQMFRRGRVTSPNAYAAQLRVINNVRMQRACQFSIKKIAVNNIVDTSNYQRLVSGLAGPEFAALMSANAGPESGGMMVGRPGQPPPVEKTTSNIINIGLPGKKGGARGNGGGVANVEAPAVIIQQQTSQQRPNPIMINASIFPGSANGNDIDFKIFQYKKQQAELKRNQLEDDLKVRIFQKGSEFFDFVINTIF